jgi:CHRD domain
MNPKRLQAVAALALTALVAMASMDALAQGRPLSTTLTGAAEVPGPGDPDGTGEVFMTINSGQGLVCFQLSVADIAPATAAHIHIGPVGVAGPVVVPLPPPTSGFSSACVSADHELLRDIIHDPANYYVNVHNASFPAGAVRGQLSK